MVPETARGLCWDPSPGRQCCARSSMLGRSYRNGQAVKRIEEMVLDTCHAREGIQVKLSVGGSGLDWTGIPSSQQSACLGGVEKSRSSAPSVLPVCKLWGYAARTTIHPYNKCDRFTIISGRAPYFLLRHFSQALPHTIPPRDLSVPAVVQ